ncbi:hypothetical protein [Streptomyces sp. UNOB3_S3]|uniref:hypothetical protein n=1 Tax=Streptomyces sp. UNOB3_S3 TaxID=2871682 RepID=UPI001E52E359|nr:hypothetical protein [Streptomyces sp. UNOB3_S3]MCC3777146.1 hypothetical protein [Streptomyces sp. UNOB3_S3]
MFRLPGTSRPCARAAAGATLALAAALTLSLPPAAQAATTSPAPAASAASTADVATPTGFVVTGDLEGITLDWTPVEGATEYRVYRSNLMDRSSPFATVAAPTFRDTDVEPDHSKTYWVSAVDADGTESAPTERITGTRLWNEQSPPSAPSINLTRLRDRLIISWFPDNINPWSSTTPVDRLVVYRSKTSPVRPETGAEQIHETLESFVDFSMAAEPADDDYYYAIAAVPSSEKARWAFSPSYKPELRKPPAPRAHMTDRKDGRVVVAWHQDDTFHSSVLRGYNVYRSDSPTMTKKTSQRIGSLDYRFREGSYSLVDSQPLPGRAYYAITTEDAFGIESDLSNVVTYTPKQ